jgi:hypothetical protein
MKYTDTIKVPRRIFRVSTMALVDCPLNFLRKLGFTTSVIAIKLAMVV